MNIKNLEDGNILSISIDQGHCLFEMVVSLHDDTCCKLTAWNDDGVELTIRMGALNLHFRAGLGELEGISVVNNVLIIEGDFGDLEIEAANVVVEKLRQVVSIENPR